MCAECGFLLSLWKKCKHPCKQFDLTGSICCFNISAHFFINAAATEVEITFAKGSNATPSKLMTTGSCCWYSSECNVLSYLFRGKENQHFWPFWPLLSVQIFPNIVGNQCCLLTRLVEAFVFYRTVKEMLVDIFFPRVNRLSFWLKN